MYEQALVQGVDRVFSRPVGLEGMRSQTTFFHMWVLITPCHRVWPSLRASLVHPLLRGQSRNTNAGMLSMGLAR